MKEVFLIGVVIFFTSCEYFDDDKINSFKTSHSKLDEYHFQIDSVNGITCYYDHSGKLVNIILTENENISYLYFGNSLSVDSILKANMITQIGFKHVLNKMNEQKVVIYRNAMPGHRIVSQIFRFNMELDLHRSNYIFIEKTNYGEYDFFIGMATPYDFAVFHVGTVNDARDKVLDVKYEMSVDSVDQRFYMTIEEEEFEGIAYFGKDINDSVRAYDEVYFKYPQESKIEDIKRDLNLREKILGIE